MALSTLYNRLTRTDYCVILLLVMLLLISLFWSVGRPAGHRVLIYNGDKIVFSGPLNQNRILDLEGPLGMTQVVIAEAKVRVSASVCARKICIGMGEVERSGDLLACVPNRIVVRIVGGAKRDYDLLSR